MGVERLDQDTPPAGKDSPHLDRQQKRQAAERAPIGSLVIHEIVRQQGEEELARSFNGLAWSSLAAGLSLGFSFTVQAYLQAGLPDTAWRNLVAGFGYALGFLIVILGQQQLFTETTLTALIPTLTRRDLRTMRATLRVWAIVLVFNLLGTLLFGALLCLPGVFPPAATAAMLDISHHVVSQPFFTMIVSGVAAGWLIGLTVWLLPGAGPARPLIIILLTYAIALLRLPHIIAGSVEASFAVFTGHATVLDYFWKFLLPTLIGNTVGGTALVALLNHAPIAEELREEHASE